MERTNHQLVKDYLIVHLNLTAREAEFLDGELDNADYYYDHFYKRLSTPDFVKFYFNNEVLYCNLKYALDDWKETAKSLVSKFEKFLGITVSKPSCY